MDEPNTLKTTKSKEKIIEKKEKKKKHTYACSRRQHQQRRCRRRRRRRVHNVIYQLVSLLLLFYFVHHMNGGYVMRAIFSATINNTVDSVERQKMCVHCVCNGVDKRAPNRATKRKKERERKYRF